MLLPTTIVVSECQLKKEHTEVNSLVKSLKLDFTSIEEFARLSEWT
jgi:hypothetical protein